MALTRLKWKLSYGTKLFDTLDGDIDDTQYVVANDINGNKKGYYVRLNSNKESHNFNIVDSSYDVSGLTEVQVIGEIAYDVFDLGNGKLYRRKSTINEYKALALKNARGVEKDMEESEVRSIRNRI